MTDLTPPEGQPKERVIEVNEWFTPFENYVELPSGNIISHRIDSIEKWVDQNTGDKFNTPAFPDVSNLLRKLRARIVPID